MLIRFQSPVGTEAERSSRDIWPGGWTDATGYLKKYGHGIHTGADLNWNSPKWNADKHQPVYAIGRGTVTYAQLYSRKLWGKIVVIYHGIVDGKPLFSRYAHLHTIDVFAEQTVTAGLQIGTIGDGEGLFTPKPGWEGHHLHFDISTSEVLRKEPQNWPAPNSNPDPRLVMQHYVDPRKWLRESHNVSDMQENELIDNQKHIIAPTVASTVWFVIAPAGVAVRNDHSASAEQVGLLPLGSELSIDETGAGNQDGFTWAAISAGQFKGLWLAIAKSDKSETYVSTNAPRK